MNRANAQTEIRKLAPWHDKVRLTEHAKKRDPASGKLPLTKREIMATLEHGSIVEGPFSDRQIAGGWTFTVERNIDEQRCRVAGVLAPEEFILVITGYAIDPQTRPKGRRIADDDDEDIGDEDVSIH